MRSVCFILWLVTYLYPKFRYAAHTAIYFILASQMRLFCSFIAFPRVASFLLTRDYWLRRSSIQI